MTAARLDSRAGVCDIVFWAVLLVVGCYGIVFEKFMILLSSYVSIAKGGALLME